jgi:hypothetical protein
MALSIMRTLIDDGKKWYAVWIKCAKFEKLVLFWYFITGII